MASKNDRNKQDLVKLYSETLSNFAKSGPNLISNPMNYAAMSLAANRLHSLSRLLLTSNINLDLSEETISVVSDAIGQQNKIIEELDARTLAGGRAGFDKFDDVAFYNHVKELPEEQITQLLTFVIVPPTGLNPLDWFNQSSILEEFGIKLAGVGRGAAIGFKIIAILILVLVVIGNRRLIPFALATIAALKAFDEAGEADEEDNQEPDESSDEAPDDDDTSPKPIPMPFGGSYTPSEDHSVVILPDGTVIIVTDTSTVTIEPDGTTTTTFPPPSPSPPPPETSARSFIKTLVHCQRVPVDVPDGSIVSVKFFEASLRGSVEVYDDQRLVETLSLGEESKKYMVPQIGLHYKAHGRATAKVRITIL